MLVLGFVGVLVILRPGLAAVQPGALVMLFGAFCFAVQMIQTKRLVGKTVDGAQQTFADVRCLIGKDIIRHHCVYWPAMLMSAGIEPPAGWAVGGWLLVGGEKMSKTSGNVVNPLELVDEIGVDGFRYYVLAETPYGQDGDFTYEGLIGRYNSDLANNLGNLAARVATVVGKKCDGIGTAPAADSPLAAVAAEADRVEPDAHGGGELRGHPGLAPCRERLRPPARDRVGMPTRRAEADALGDGGAHALEVDVADVHARIDGSLGVLGQSLVSCPGGNATISAEGSWTRARRDDEVVSEDTSRRSNAARGHEHPRNRRGTSGTGH